MKARVSMANRPAPRFPGQPRAERAAGFSLLEVMIALAILAISLVVLIGIATNNVRATNHSKLMTAATFLARSKMADIEQRILELGFGDLDEEDAGTFDDLGFPQYRWTSLVEKVELPTNITQSAQTEATQAGQASSDPMQALTGFVGGMLSDFIEPVRVGLQESVRRVTLNVTWDEPARDEQSLEVVTFLTDPARLDMALGVVGGEPQNPAPASTPASKPSSRGRGARFGGQAH